MMKDIPEGLLLLYPDILSVRNSSGQIITLLSTRADQHMENRDTSTRLGRIR
jgi:hypothetical protein